MKGRGVEKICTCCFVESPTRDLSSVWPESNPGGEGRRVVVGSVSGVPSFALWCQGRMGSNLSCCDRFVQSQMIVKETIFKIGGPLPPATPAEASFGQGFYWTGAPVLPRRRLGILIACLIRVNVCIVIGNDAVLKVVRVVHETVPGRRGFSASSSVRGSAKKSSSLRKCRKDIVFSVTPFVDRLVFRGALAPIASPAANILLRGGSESPFTVLLNSVQVKYEIWKIASADAQYARQDMGIEDIQSQYDSEVLFGHSSSPAVGILVPGRWVKSKYGVRL